VSYDGHISIVYSDRPDCSDVACTYRIIHASGDRNVCYSQEGQPDNCSFNRKAIINLINENLKSDTLKNPIGFGMIKLWN
jgi:hypothetical protein